MNAIKILLKTGKRFDKKIENIKKDRKGNYNFMCVFDEIYDDGVEYGIEKGIERGIEQGIRTLIKFSYDNNLGSDIIKNALIDSYNLSEEKAEYYIDEYTKSVTI